MLNETIFKIIVILLISISVVVCIYNVNKIFVEQKQTIVNQTGDKQDQIIKLQKQTNNELALLICTNPKNIHLTGNNGTYKTQLQCINRVLGYTK